MPWLLLLCTAYQNCPVFLQDAVTDLSIMDHFASITGSFPITAPALWFSRYSHLKLLYFFLFFLLHEYYLFYFYQADFFAATIGGLSAIAKFVLDFLRSAEYKSGTLSVNQYLCIGLYLGIIVYIIVKYAFIKKESVI